MSYLCSFLDSVFCYAFVSQVEKYAEATAAAYTYFLANLDNEIVQKNIQYYRRLPQVKTAYFKNLEEKPYQVIDTKVSKSL